MNPKPYLIIVTGRPGSGKTTFAKKLGSEIFMPVICRDEIKEGYVHSFGKKHTKLPANANKEATDIFFDILMELISRNISVIAEAAFQHEVWSCHLGRFIEKTKTHLIICKPDARVALERFINRGLSNPRREYFHGDKGVNMARQGIDLSVSDYIEPQFDIPTLYIDTTGDYNPSIKDVVSIIFRPVGTISCCSS